MSINSFPVSIDYPDKSELLSYTDFIVSKQIVRPSTFSFDCATLLILITNSEIENVNIF